MAKSWMRRYRLTFVLIVVPILGFVIYLDTKELSLSLAATVLGGLLAYLLLLPLAHKLSDFIDCCMDRLKKKWGLNREN